MHRSILNCWSLKYSSNHHRRGVGIILANKIRSSEIDFIPYGDRTMFLRLRTSQYNVSIVQILAPTTDGSDEEMEKFYKKVNELMKLIRPEELTFVIGIRCWRTCTVGGKFDLGDSFYFSSLILAICPTKFHFNSLVTSLKFRLFLKIYFLLFPASPSTSIFLLRFALYRSFCSVF